MSVSTFTPLFSPKHSELVSSPLFRYPRNTAHQTIAGATSLDLVVHVPVQDFAQVIFCRSGLELYALGNEEQWREAGSTVEQRVHTRNRCINQVQCHAV